VRVMEEALRDGIIDRNPARVTGWQREYKLDSSKDWHGRWPPRWRENGAWWARVSSEFLVLGVRSKD
jgi:hypothetical protein